MGRSILINFYLISFQLVLLCLFSNNMITATCQLSPNPLVDLACALVKCGEGTCTPSNTTLIGFECDCKPGWKQIQIGPLTFPSCLVPNCTINFQCGNGAPPPPPPTPPPPPPQSTTSNTSACNGVWCGDGNCVVNRTGDYYCQCNEGSSNLLDQTAFACFKQCYFGTDCNILELWSPPPPPPSTSSSSPKTGSNGAPNSLKNFQAPIILVLTSIFLTWI